VKNFTGIDSPYQPPEHAEIHIDIRCYSPEQTAEIIVRHLLEMSVQGTSGSGSST
jgi:bifunctional enzyme CysN/CysC